MADGIEHLLAVILHSFLNDFQNLYTRSHKIGMLYIQREIKLDRFQSNEMTLDVNFLRDNYYKIIEFLIKFEHYLTNVIVIMTAHLEYP